MFPSARLKLLQQRKQELLHVSEVERRLWAVEGADIQRRLQWLDRTVTTARSIHPWCNVALPLLRLWLSRGEHPSKSWLGKIATALPVVRQVGEVWKVFSQRRNGDRPVAREDEQNAPVYSRRTTV
jgi:hypothetical protein